MGKNVHLVHAVGFVGNSILVSFVQEANIMIEASALTKNFIERIIGIFFNKNKGLMLILQSVNHLEQ